MYAVIEVPEFPLEALSRESRRRLGGALAVVDATGSGAEVVSASGAARRGGVTAGMSPSRALARCAGLRLLPRSAEAEARAERLTRLLARTFAPRIEATAPGLVTADLRGIRREGCVEGAERLVERFREAGLGARIGLADTPDHALWAARLARPVRRVLSAERFLEGLPVAAAGVPEDMAALLADWGIGDLGAFGRLPREAVGERLGRRGLELWDAVTGRRVRVLRPHTPAPRFERRRESEYRIESTQALLFPLRRMVDELAAELEAAQAAAFVLKLDLEVEDRGRLRRVIEVPEASGRAGTLFRILETALEGLRTPGAVMAVGLKLETAAARPRQGDLFAVAMEDAAGFAETADRVAAIVGPGRSGSPRVEDCWRPDAFRMERLEADAGSAPEAAGEAGAEAPRAGPPLERFRPPRAVVVLRTGGRPAALRGAGCTGRVVRAEGPWRTSGGWWDARPWAREEWDVALEGGVLHRIFRESGAWYVEGTYG